MAVSQSYYRLEGDQCDYASDDMPLLVNCAGQNVSEHAFTSVRQNGRKDYYLMFLKRGSMDLLLRDETIEIKKGEGVILAPGRPLCYTFSGVNGPLEYYWAHFTGSEAHSLLESTRLGESRLFKVQQSEDIIQRFKELMSAFLVLDEWQANEAAGQLMALLSHLGRAAAADDERADIAPIRRSLGYMNEFYAKALSVRELAAMEFMSPSRYSTIFRSIMGTSPKDYLIRLRMNNAMDMLDKTDLSVKQVALAVGYDDPLYFSRLFKKRAGISPRMLRNGGEKGGDH